MLPKRSIATIELLLIFPASLFMLSLFFREVQPETRQPAETARLIVNWFAARTHIGLHLFLMAFPFTAFVLGAATTLRTWRNDQHLRQRAADTLAIVRAHAAFLLIVAATLIAGGILSIVALHALTD